MFYIQDMWEVFLSIRGSICGNAAHIGQGPAIDFVCGMYGPTSSMLWYLPAGGVQYGSRTMPQFWDQILLLFQVPLQGLTIRFLVY